jgi:hypothetical protein
LSTEERARRGNDIGGDRAGRTQSGNRHRSPRRGSSHQIQLEEGVEGVGATILPQASAVEATRAGRNGWPVATVTRVRRGAREGEGELEEPTQVLAGWVRPSRVDWARPMGQSPVPNQIQNFKF